MSQGITAKGCPQAEEESQEEVVEHLLWDAYQDDGSTVERWSLEGVEQIAPPWTTRQFHLYTLHKPLVNSVLHVPRGAEFRCGMRGNVFVAGWEMPDSLGAWLFLSPSCEIELAPWEAHRPRFAFHSV
jgi:hypothetical protein